MLTETAQKVVDATQSIIGEDVIITNEKGIIIGSSDKSRLGTLHATSLPVMKFNRVETCDPEKALRKKVKPGVALPIIYAGKVVGSIGIAGDPEEVIKYAHLVRKEAEIFLREKNLLANSHLRERALHNLIQEIISFHPAEMDESLLITQAGGLGYDLRLPRIAILIDISRFRDLAAEIRDKASSQEIHDTEVHIESFKMSILNNIRSVFSNPQNIISSFGADKYLVIRALHPRNNSHKDIRGDLQLECRKMLSTLEDRNINAAIGIGRIAIVPPCLADSYYTAWRALHLGKKLSQNSCIYDYRELMVEDLLSTLNTQKCKLFVKQQLVDSLSELPNWPDLRKTFLTWMKDPFNPGEVAKKLNIHRNTLSYRLEKIAHACEINIKNFDDVFSLYLAVKARQVLNLHSGKDALPKPQ